MTVDDSTASMRNSSPNMCFLAPDQVRSKQESEGRLKSAREVGVAAKKEIQCKNTEKGFTQVILQGINELTVNVSKPIYCSFCHGNHAVNSNKCEKQAMLKQGAMVYKLTLSDESQGKNLKDRIKMTMPLNEHM